MIDLNWRPRAFEPRILGAGEKALPNESFRLCVADLEPQFHANPLFADRIDAHWFLSRAWNQTPPAVGAYKGRVRISVENGKYVLLHRYGEGVIFDEAGTSNSPGFLANMQTLPPGMEKRDQSFHVDPSILEACPRLSGRWAIFYNGNLQNYYHWLVEGMLSLELMKAAELLPEQTVLPFNLPTDGQFDHYMMMQALGYGDLAVTRTMSPYVWCEAVVHVECNEIQYYPASSLRKFQRRVLEKINIRKFGQKLLIMRQELRSISNIADLIGYLVPLGFESIYLEGMSINEQIALFGGATFVVSPHGAGMSNLIFAPPDCKVVELSPDCEMRPFFWEISCKLGHGYGMLPCPTHDGRFNGRLHVDMDKFRRLFSMVEAQL